MKKIESLRIYGRRWFQKSYGNTYHTTRVVVNGEELKSEITYGYEEHYKETARQLLDANGYEVPQNPLEFNRFLNSKGFKATAVDVDRKRDL